MVNAYLAPFISLYSHPSLSPAVPIRLEAKVEANSDDSLVFSYRCRYEPIAEIGILLPELPESTAPVAQDFLWQHTCCEAFVGAADRSDYLEFNFSPSGCWAVYRFEDYRARDEAFACMHAPKIQCTVHEDGFDLTARISTALLPKATDRMVGLSAVIETTDGQKSYWALRHDAPQPDFHLRSQFFLSL